MRKILPIAMKKETGYEICNHTCRQEECISRATKTPLWNKEGNSATRHAQTATRHPNCTTDCPANGAGPNPVYVRDATEAELAQWASKLGHSIQTAASSAAKPVAAAPGLLGPSRSSSTPTSIAQLKKPKMSVIFVADPTRYSTLQDAVEWDSVYWQYPDITPDEFDWLHQVFGACIFRKSADVFIQEFVSSPHGVVYYVH